MEARCPHCTTVFPTEQLGVQNCPACGKQVRVAEVAPVAVAPVQPPSSGPAPPLAALVAWERRRELGVVTAFVSTWKKSMFSPKLFWAEVAPAGSQWDALSYGWLVWTLSSLASFPLDKLQARIGAEFVRNLSDREALAALSEPLREGLENLLARASEGPSVGGLVFGVVSFPVLLMVLTALTHLFALLFGTAKHGFVATFRVMGYSWSPWLLAWIPFPGSLLALVYLYVVTVLGLAAVQEGKTDRALLSVLAVPLILGCCLCCAVGAVVLTGFSALTGH